MKQIIIRAISIISFTVEAISANEISESSQNFPENHQKFLNILWNTEIVKQLADKEMTLRVEFNNVDYYFNLQTPNTCPLMLEVFKYYYKTRYTNNLDTHKAEFKVTLYKKKGGNLLDSGATIIQNASLDYKENQIEQTTTTILTNRDLEKNYSELNSLLDKCLIQHLDGLNKTSPNDVSLEKMSLLPISNRYELNSKRSPKEIIESGDSKQMPERSTATQKR